MKMFDLHKEVLGTNLNSHEIRNTMLSTLTPDQHSNVIDHQVVKTMVSNLGCREENLRKFLIETDVTLVLKNAVPVLQKLPTIHHYLWVHRAQYQENARKDKFYHFDHRHVKPQGGQDAASNGSLF